GLRRLDRGRGRRGAVVRCNGRAHPRVAAATLLAGPVAQRIERQPSKLRAEVRLLPGPFKRPSRAPLRGSGGGLFPAHSAAALRAAATPRVSSPAASSLCGRLLALLVRTKSSLPRECSSGSRQEPILALGRILHAAQTRRTARCISLHSVPLRSLRYPPRVPRFNLAHAREVRVRSVGLRP